MYTMYIHYYYALYIYHYCLILYYNVLFYIVLYCIVFYSILLYCIVLYCIVLYSIVSYHIILYYIIYLCCAYTQDQISRISPAQTSARLSSWRFPAGKSQLKSQVYPVVNHRKMEVLMENDRKPMRKWRKTIGKP